MRLKCGMCVSVKLERSMFPWATAETAEEGSWCTPRKCDRTGICEKRHKLFSGQ